MEVDLSDAIHIAKRENGNCMGCGKSIVDPQFIPELFNYIVNQAPKYSGWITGKTQERSAESRKLDGPGNLTGDSGNLGSGPDESDLEGGEVMGRWGNVNYRDFKFIDTGQFQTNKPEDMLFVHRECTKTRKYNFRIPIWLLAKVTSIVDESNGRTNISKTINRALINYVKPTTRKSTSHLVIQIDDMITKEIEGHLSDASNELESAKEIIRKYRDTVNEVAEKLVDASDDA